MRYGPNRLPEGKKQTVITRFLLQFHNILVYILLAAAFVKMLTGAWLDAAVILSVVIINGVLGFLQEGRAEKALGSIRTMLSAEARCVRDGEVRLVPADLRLTEVKNLRTEEAALTGESVPADKTIEAVSGKATVGDRKGMAFSGTLVTSGRGRGVVVATGAGTELGRINQADGQCQSAARGRQADRQPLRDMAHRFRRHGAAHAHPSAFLPCKVERCVR